jgi:alpha-ketoglutarate-dependent taurine dioxygenase
MTKGLFEQGQLDQTGFVNTQLLAPGSSLPLVIQPATRDIRPDDLTAWLTSNRESIETALTKHGALLFRDFPLSTVEDFEQFALALSGKLLEYNERSSPRTEVGRNVYTSTDYDASETIFPHNELSYAVSFPLKLFFFCQLPAKSGGQTPLAGTRRISQRLSPEVRERFLQKKWMYVRNFGRGLGVPWQTAFQTSDKESVEDFARRNRIEIEWCDGDRLRTRQVRPAFVTHPRTQELLWFNHATFFHISTLGEAIGRVLIEAFGEENLPNNTYYGDGSPIEPSVLDQLREAYVKETVSFDWQKGDTVILDNILVAHSRLPFEGAREVRFAMSDLITRTDV